MNSTLPYLYGDSFIDQMLSVLNDTSCVESNKSGYPVDIVEVADDKGQVSGYEIIVALAGIKKENVDITTDMDSLSIVVNKVQNTESKNRRYLKRGISQRQMELRYGLHGIDPAKIKASFEEGMLRVELPIAEEVKPKSIVIG